MTRGTRLIAWGSFAATAVLCLVTAVFLVLARDVPTLPNEFGPKGFGIAFALSLGGVGAVVAARRPANPIGWIFCVLGVGSAVMAVGAEYARWALLAEDGRPPGGLYAAWFEEWLWIPLVAGLAIVAAIFPDGRLLSPRWRRATIVAAALVPIPTVLTALVPDLTIYEGYENPVGIGGRWLIEVSEATIVLLLPLMFIGTASAVVRFRRARGEERQQLKWLVLSMSVVVAMITFYGFVAFWFTSGTNPQDVEWAEWGMVVGFVAVPISIAFGVLKYRLYDIDLVINRAVVYGALAAFITFVYVAIVVGVGTAVGTQGDALLSAIAAAVVALAFQPARRWAQRLANRLVYGRRATPYEVLSELSTRFAETYSLDDALPRLARVTAEAVGADRARIWLRRDGALHAAASWPSDDIGEVVPVEDDDTAELDGDRAFTVRHQGQLLGAISVRMPPSEPLSAPQEKLVRDVAAHAGLVLRNVALVADLRASRQRIVSAQDERARKLERDIHDGAQQRLVAIAVKLRLAEQLILTDPNKAHEAIAALHDDANDALETLRDLARGIYPPLLADQGLAVALESQARKAAVPVTVDAEGVGRYAQEVEAAVYFSALEAMQNVAKYADATRVAITLEQRDGVLSFAVEDDGAGFEPEKVSHGSGLTNIRDRLEALGGTISVRSAPGSGTTVIGRVPAAPGEAPR